MGVIGHTVKPFCWRHDHSCPGELRLGALHGVRCDVSRDEGLAVLEKTFAFKPVAKPDVHDSPTRKVIDVESLENTMNLLLPALADRRASCAYVYWEYF